MAKVFSGVNDNNEHVTETQQFNLNKWLQNQLIDNTDEDPLDTRHCNSYYVDELCLTLKQDEHKKYIIIHINIHSIPSKFDRLNLLLSTLTENNIEIHAVLLCETFLYEFNKNLYNISGYNLFTNNRSAGKRGGVAIYIRDNISAKIRPDLEVNVENEFESIFIEATFAGEKTIIGEIYRVPNTNESDSIDRYDAILKK